MSKESNVASSLTTSENSGLTSKLCIVAFLTEWSVRIAGTMHGSHAHDAVPHVVISGLKDKHWFQRPSLISGTRASRKKWFSAPRITKYIKS